MELVDKEWKEFWSKELFPASAPNFKFRECFGIYWEPDSSRWCASLMEPVRDKISKSFVLLDWGCGDGRLFNFLSKRFSQFKYYGLERPGEFGAGCIETARGFFRHDPRAEFDLTTGPVAAKALETSQFAILGSVATHIPFPDFRKIIQTLMPILDRGGEVISSFFIEKEYSLKAPGNCYGHQDCFALVSYTQAQIDSLCQEFNLTGAEKSTCNTMGCLHRILVFWKSRDE